jgi:hypothetical protein
MATFADLSNLSKRLKGFLEDNDTLPTSAERVITDSIRIIDEYVEQNTDDGK